MTFYRQIIGLLLITSCGQIDDHSEIRGVRAVAHIKESFFLYTEKQAEISDIAEYIEMNGSSQNNTVNDANLAAYIIYAALEAQLDPWILTALIRKESAFKQSAVSPTNAAGLTQFTGLAIREVHDQLGLRGTEQAAQSAIDHWEDFIPRTYNAMTGNDWQAPEEHWGSTFTKEQLKDDPARSVLYGVILLKTYLSWKKHNNPDAELGEIYRLALEQYNGDPPVKERYAIKIREWADEMNEPKEEG